jgi:hypothetical protein
VLLGDALLGDALTCPPSRFTDSVRELGHRIAISCEGSDIPSICSDYTVLDTTIYNNDASATPRQWRRPVRGSDRL